MNSEFKEKIHDKTFRVGVIGLGYVGLPLSLEFSKKQKCFISGKNLKRKIIGFDINPERLKELKQLIITSESNALIEVDGGVNKDNFQDLKSNGADVLVAGSYIFNSPDYNLSLIHI